MRTFRLAMAQINTTVGDLESNTRKVLNYIRQAQSVNADLIAFPELVITGYPPEDLLFKRQFVQNNLAKAQQVIDASKDITVVFGFVDGNTDIYNAAAIAYNRKIVGVYHKIHLPNYGVFDEKRYFKTGSICPVYIINGTFVGINICEDIWYENGPTAMQRAAGAELIVNINGSPFHVGKRHIRQNMLTSRASDNAVYIAYLNMVGGQDELVFDGTSTVVGPSGEIVTQGSQFKEELILTDLEIENVIRVQGTPSNISKDMPPGKLISVSNYSTNPRSRLPHYKPTLYDGFGEVYAALVLGTKDYVRKCGFSKVTVALSGGIDSSLVAVIAVDALGPDNVIGVSMPSRYSSKGSVSDAKKLSDNLSIELRNIPIEEAFSSHLNTLSPHFADNESGLTEENLQSRIRGVIMMALSNKFGWLVLTTGNKSEMAVGYATIYGDMAGGYGVIKDVPKTMVYQLVKHRNLANDGSPIPISILEKPPSAELRPNQRDEDSLPPYTILDQILKAYVEEDLSFNEIADMGFEKDVIKQVVTLVDKSEYKRRQSPPGIKITPRNFGRDRRMPISNRYTPF